MARSSSQFTTIRTEGGLLPAAILERVALADGSLPGLTTDSYHLAKGERFGEVINRSWLRLVGAWAGLKDALAATAPGAATTGLTRDRWLLILFQELGYGRLQPAKRIEVDGEHFPVSHEWGNVPIHLVGAGVKLDTRTAGVAGAARSSPHSLIQDLLNRSDERLWGIVSNGLQLRLLRDNVALTRQSYVEFDLEAMMDGEVFADFTLLWLLAHQSRVEGDHPEASWLERWSIEARTQGSRALEHLSDGVAGAVEALGSGFLEHADNVALRDALQAGELRPKDLYRQLLRVVYRLLFVLVAEERDRLLLPASEASADARSAYTKYYSVRRIRELSERRRGTRHADLWQQIQTVVRVLGSDGCDALALPALGSALFSPEATPAINECSLANDDLLTAMRHLSGRSDDRVGYRWRFDYRNLGAEELGSVYESLLDLDAEIVVPSASFRLNTGGGERRSTGSHYTPTPILKRVLDFALEPAIERARRSDDPQSALLDLRILDPACGSGHFLIAAGHRIAEALATVRTGETSPAPEAVTAALRDVVARCLYGVDLNPLAVELCRIALWLDALEPGKPLSFLGHHIRVGNSLLGVPLGVTVERNRSNIDARRKELQDRIAQLETALRGLRPADPDRSEASKELTRLRKELGQTVYDSWADAIPDIAFSPTADDDRSIARRATAANKRERRSGQLALAPTLVELPDDLVAVFDQLGAGAETNLAEVTVRAEMFDGVQRRSDYRHLIHQADVWTAAFFWPMSPGEPPPPTQAAFATLKSNPHALPADVEQIIEKERAERHFLHFELAFPEVFTADRGGFDALVGNPPFLGGNDLTARYGAKVAQFLRNTADEARGHTDLSAYFLRRAFDLLRDGGDLGLITTDKITAADSRNASLVPITTQWGGELADAVTSIQWEGAANVMVAVIHLRSGAWIGQRTLDGEQVAAITPALEDADLVAADEPVALPANRLRAFQGSNLLGKGFVLRPDAAQRLIADDARNAEVVKPLFGADELTSLPTVEPTRWVINFGDRDKEAAAAYREPFSIVERLVKPQRETNRDRRRREIWWQFTRPASALYSAIGELDRVIAMPLVTKTFYPLFLPNGWVYSHKLAVIALDDYGSFGALSSAFHWSWAVTRSSPRGADRITYSTSAAFETFPFPPSSTGVAEAAEALDVYRRDLMREMGVGLTPLYNLVDDPDCDTEEINALRSLHRALDLEVCAAYGWEDLDLVHDIWRTQRGERYTVTEVGSRELLRRLVRLNLERAAQLSTP